MPKSVEIERVRGPALVATLRARGCERVAGHACGRGAARAARMRLGKRKGRLESDRAKIAGTFTHEWAHRIAGGHEW